MLKYFSLGTRTLFCKIPYVQPKWFRNTQRDVTRGILQVTSSWQHPWRTFIPIWMQHWIWRRTVKKCHPWGQKEADHWTIAVFCASKRARNLSVSGSNSRYMQGGLLISISSLHKAECTAVNVGQFGSQVFCAYYCLRFWLQKWRTQDLCESVFSTL
jgi:hypothetical protein